MRVRFTYHITVAYIMIAIIVLIVVCHMDLPLPVPDADGRRGWLMERLSYEQTVRPYMGIFVSQHLTN